MTGVVIYLCFIAILLGPATIVAALPSSYARPLAGWIILGVGLVWLAERNIPFQDQGMLAGAGTSWAQIVAATIVVAITFRLIKDHSYARRTPPAWLADWQPPIAILVAVFGFHWLANRLAGYGPARDVHLIALASCGAVIVVLAFMLRQGRWRIEPRPFALGLAVAMLALVVRAAWTAHENIQLARQEADNRPFCVLSFAGRGREFHATSWWQLSPMVSRDGGRSYEDTRARWLFVDDQQPHRTDRGWKRDGSTIYRDSRVPEPSEYGQPRPFPCSPRYGGGIAD